MSDLALLRSHISKRRTFAIISHPDAGKTTLTEKLLLYGGAIHLAGSVKSRRAARHATSDWMALEKERGISISTSVLQFDYAGCHFNLLDTPGHNDFSEDTYRTLAAADCAVMLIDCVKGVEPQTIKLFEVCRMRGIPIVTFINKVDRPGKLPLDLLDEIEQVLGIPCAPMTWPVGMGPSFRGVYDRETTTFYRFEAGEDIGHKAAMEVGSLDDPALKDEMGETQHAQLRDELELLDAAGNAFDRDAFLRGRITPVFFGSAMNNFGVEPFLARFMGLCPPPSTRFAGDVEIPADAEYFTGFVFKIQANMDPQHRDRIAFVRICSGKFDRGMDVRHVRTKKKLTLSRSLNFLAQERVTVDEAYSGDIVGVWDPGVLRIGDALSTGPDVEFDGIPRFSPEHFVRVRSADPMKRKQLKKGLEELSDEGAVLLLFDRDENDAEPILGTVGPLQFDVVQYRLKAEYGVPALFDRLPYNYARWIEETPTAKFVAEEIVRRGSIACVYDVERRPLLLFDTEWVMHRTQEKLSGLKFIAAAQPGRRAHGKR
ncbi:MAG TPA: peptide chain release factor 3 [Polyangiaceae bacterium]|nr:peptide chain release factor 3 [Polyangiaceae bacterium]